MKPIDLAKKYCTAADKDCIVSLFKQLDSLYKVNILIMNRRVISNK